MIGQILDNLEGPGFVNDQSFSEIGKRVRRCSDRLANEAGDSRKLVAVQVGSASEFVVAFLGICVSGNVPVLVDRQQRLDKKLSAGIDFLLTDNRPDDEPVSMSWSIDFDGLTLVSLKKDEFDAERLSSWRNDPRVGCCLFSSGSEGRPQFVAKTFANLQVELEELARMFAVRESDVFVSNMPLSHLYGLIWGCLLPLSQAASFVSAGGETARGLVNRCRQHRATFVCTVPLFYRHLSEILKRQREGDSLASVREFISSGDRLPAVVAEAFRLASNQSITSVYGMTETGAIFVGRDQPRSDLGQPMSYLDLKIDEGCLNLRGPNLFGSGWFRTGDMIRREGDDYFFLGRSKRMIKNGAKSVSPVHIEECILRCPGVADVFVFGQSDSVHGELPVAQIVLSDVPTIPLERIKSHCRERLQSAEMPRKFYVVEQIHRDARGKVPHPTAIQGIE